MRPAPEAIGSVAEVQVAKVMVPAGAENLSLPEKMLTVALVQSVAPSAIAWVFQDSGQIEKRPLRWTDGGASPDMAENCDCPPIFEGRGVLLFLY